MALVVCLRTGAVSAQIGCAHGRSPTGEDLNANPGEHRKEKAKRPGNRPRQHLRPMAPAKGKDQHRQEKEATGKDTIERPGQRAVAAQRQRRKIDEKGEEGLEGSFSGRLSRLILR